MNTWILVLIIIVLAWVLVSKKNRDQLVGVCVSALDQTVRKNANKEKVLTLLAGGALSNSTLRGELGVSDRTIVRYMDELEREGRVEQIGTTGHAVTYRLKS